MARDAEVRFSKMGKMFVGSKANAGRKGRRKGSDGRSLLQQVPGEAGEGVIQIRFLFQQDGWKGKKQSW